MEPRIRFTTTTEAVRIAYARVSETGPPVIWTRSPGISLLDGLRFFPGIGIVAEQASVTLFDQPGCGASQRTDVDMSVAGVARAIEAVADAIDARDLTVIGTGPSCAGTASFVAANPHRVARFVCFDPGPVDTDIWDMDFLRSNWSMSRRFVAHMMFPQGPLERQKEFGEAMAAAMSHEDYVRSYEAYHEADWGIEFFRRITVPALVVRHLRHPSERERLERVLSAMPHCEYIERTGTGGLADDSIENAKLALQFMGLHAPAASRASRTSIILFADIADSTALTERLGDAVFREKARALDDALRTAVRQHGGAVIDAKTLGDGILATFPAASQAIAAALACEAAGRHAGLPLHLGLHAGDIIRESDNVFGGAVNIAARISALSAPGEVLVSATVRDLGRTSAGVGFEDRGEHKLKGIAEPQRVFAVRASEAD